MNGPIAAIIISVIITIGALFGTGSLMPEPNTYATVNFDGGYKKIGVINQEDIFTLATVFMDGKSLTSGKFQDVISWMEDQALNSGGVDKVTWKAGVKLVARVGIEWVGSESNFQLTTDRLEIASTAENPIIPATVISKLNVLEQKAKSERIETAKQTLTFGPTPKESFFISKVLSALSKYSK